MMAGRRRKPVNPDRLPAVLNLTEIADLLGVDSATARAMVVRGLIPALQFGTRVVRASKAAVLRALESGGKAMDPSHVALDAARVGMGASWSWDGQGGKEEVR